MFSLNKYTGMMKSNIRLKIMEVCEDINDMREDRSIPFETNCIYRTLIIRVMIADDITVLSFI